MGNDFVDFCERRGAWDDGRPFEVDGVPLVHGRRTYPGLSREELAAEAKRERERSRLLARSEVNGWVYVLRCEATGLHKIGTSTSCSARVLSQLGETTERVFVGAMLVRGQSAPEHHMQRGWASKRHNAGYVREQELHKRFAEKRRGLKEWFDLSDDDVASIGLTVLSLEELRRAEQAYVAEWWPPSGEALRTDEDSAMVPV